MSKRYAPDMDTQVGLMKLRKNAERLEIERRSRMAESVDIGHRVIAEIRAMNTPEDKELANAKQTILGLVYECAALTRTIKHLTKAWGPPDQIQAQEEVDKLVEHFSDEIGNDPSFSGAARQWTDRQVTQGHTVGRAKIRWKPR
ncbi:MULTISPECIES: hypothetical protein [Stenotrophomonas]|uniref:hypothetical protein n=1 Tax=Stenotrophomonas TaxID=40323 RepID=UPI0015DE0EF9|nr:MULTISPECIES: hypothetical protein [Stenotrophomonas]HDS1522638.1 hypothetical protein [Stenotrophomonas maltophilia]HDS1657436.1 hypothetical protein [Stenotrophomonas maltophilia]HDS1671459.1 hypothetical protein [Stenotrophomonas maltophilia]